MAELGRTGGKYKKHMKLVARMWMIVEFFVVLTRLTCQSIVRLCCRGCLYSHDQLHVQSKEIGC